MMRDTDLVFDDPMVDISEVYFITWNEDGERVCALRRTVMVHGVEEVVYERSLTDMSPRPAQGTPSPDVDDTVVC